MENVDIIAAAFDDLHGRMDDVDAVQSLLDLISAEIAASGAMYADAVAEHAQARLRLKLTLLAAASRRAPRGLEEDLEVVAELAADLSDRIVYDVQRQEEVVVVVVEADDPEVCASTAVFLQTSVRAGHIQKYQRVLVHAQMFVVAARAVAFAQTRAHLLPGVLLTVAMAYALAYAASWGAVVPGPASLVRISILLLSFLLGIPVVGNLA